MAWEIPNEADAAVARMSSLFNPAFDDLTAGILGNGIYSGGAVTWNSGHTFDIAGGVAVINGVLVTFAATSKVTSSYSTNPWFAIISVNSSGTVTLTEGTASATPVWPELPSATDVKLATIYDDSNTLAASRVIDGRVFVRDPLPPTLRLRDRALYV